MKVLSPFGPKIASLKLSGNSIRKINIEVDKIISKKNLFNSVAIFFVTTELIATTPPNALTGSHSKAYLNDKS